MRTIFVKETKIGATTFTVERAFAKDATENAYQVIKRLMLQDARSESLPTGHYPLDIVENQR